RKIYDRYIAPHVSGVRLFGFRAKDAQNLMNRIATEHQVAHSTLVHIKSFLSGVFSFARRVGNYDLANPVQGVEIPRGIENEPTHAYSNAEIEKMLSLLDGIPHVAVTVAAYTGLSLGELAGLQWDDITSNELKVRRTIWHNIEGEPKTKARKDSIPLLPVVRDALKKHRKDNPHTKWIFEVPYVRPLDLATLGSKRIKH